MRSGWTQLARTLKANDRLPGYSLFHQDRAGRAGGGVMHHAKRHLNPIQVPIATLYKIVRAEIRRNEPGFQFCLFPAPKHN